MTIRKEMGSVWLADIDALDLLPSRADVQEVLYALDERQAG